MRGFASLAAGVVIVGCVVDEPGGQGIAIGNPPGGATRVVVADGDAVFMTEFSLELGAVYLETCTGRGTVVRVPEGTFVRLDGPSVIDVPPDIPWCAVGLVPAPEASSVLRGEVGDGGFRFEGALGRILLYGEFQVEEGEPLVLELGEPGWIAATDFPVLPGPGEELFVGGTTSDCLEDRLCSRIRAGLMNRAGLYRDEDADGALDERERERGTDAAGDSRRTRPQR